MSEQGSKKKSGSVVKTGVKVIVGIVLIALGLLAVITWWGSLWVVIRGCLGLVMIVAGAVTITIAKE